MTSDNFLLLFSFLICWSTLFFLYRAVTFKQLFLIVDLLLHIVYSLYHLFGLVYKSENGAMLAWWLNLLILLWIQSFINIVRIVYFFFKNNREEEI